MISLIYKSKTGIINTQTKHRKLNKSPWDSGHLRDEMGILHRPFKNVRLTFAVDLNGKITNCNLFTHGALLSC